VDHLDSEEILQLLSSTPGGEGNLVHLIGCARCRAKALELAALDDEGSWPTGREEPEAAPERELSRLWARIGRVEARVAAERERDAAEAGALYDELMSRPAGEREQAIEDEPRFQSLGLARRLIAGSEEAASDPPGAEALAGLAIAIGDKLDPRRFGATEAAETRAHAWCLLGDGRRQAGKDPELAFRAAARQLAAEPLDGQARGWLCHRLGLLRRDEERTDEALALFARAAAIFARLDDLPGLGAALAAEGWLRLEEGDLEGARMAFDRGLDALGPSGRLESILDVQHGLALADAELGRTTAARRAVAASRDLYGLLPGERERLLALAREAEVAERSGRDREAERIRLQAIEGLREAGAPYDAVLVALDLARAYLEEERPEEVERLRAELAPLLTGREIHPHARIAVAVAFTTRRPGTFSQVAEFVARSRHHPELSFRSCREAIAVLVWDQLGADLRRDLCRETGVAPEVGDLSSAEIALPLQERVSWTYRELAGIEIAFDECPED